MRMQNVARLNPASQEVTVAEVLERHTREISMHRAIGQSKGYTLKIIARCDIGKIYISDLQASHIVDHVNQRKREAGICAATVLKDMVNLHGALQMVKLWKVKGWERVEAEYEEAMLWLEKLNLVGKSRPRDRRPNAVELQQTLAFFDARSNGEYGGRSLPMSIIIRFAIDSLRRQGEITRLLWEDFEDTDKPMLTVRDMKDPKHKIGNHHRFPLLGCTAEIIRAQPMVDERIFPYEFRSISAGFTRAMAYLKIINLHFHDFRREGVCRMLEAGYSPAQVAAVSGHKNWSTLARVYGASINPVDVHAGPAGAQRNPEQVRTARLSMALAE